MAARRPASRALVVCAVLALALPVRAQSTAARPPSDPAQSELAFDAARGLFDGGLFGPAARAFAAFRLQHPDHSRAPEALFLHAESALASGDDQGAARLFAQFETAYPAHPLVGRARLALGRYYYATSQDDLAEAALLDALARPAPPSARAEAAYLLGQTALRQGRPDAALDAFAQAAEADTPTAPLALYATGAVAVDEGQPDRAAEAFAALAARFPASPQNAAVRLALAEAYLRTDRLQDAAAEIEARRPALTGDDAARADLLLGETRLRLGDGRGAIAPLDAVPAASPYRRRAALALGRAAYDRSDWPAAIERLSEARTPVSDRPQDDAVAHEASYYEGLALKRSGRLGEAEDRLAAAASRRPDGAYADAALLELGVLRYERRRYADAAQALDQLVRSRPQSPYAGEAARMLGESYAALGETERAREAFARAESLGTATAETRAEVAFQDAYARFRAGEYAAAVDALLRVYDQDPTGPRAGEALFWAGESAFRAERYARAEEILAEFVRLFPRHRQADAGRYVLAWTHFKRRDYRSAADGFERFLSAYQRTSESVPYYADALLRLGDSYYALGRFADARSVYARVPAATPDRQGGDYALFQTAQAFAGENDVDAAVGAYGQLVQSYPQSELYAEALAARAALLFNRGDYEAAALDYDRAVRERPASSAAARALVGLGDARFNQDRYPEAEAAYRRVLDRYASSAFAADALEGLASVLDAQGRGAEIDAEIAGFEARATNPEARARIRIARAEAALAAGDAAAAVSLLDALLAGSVPPALEPEALLLLANAHTSLDRPADAARTLRRLLARYGTGALAPEARLRLAEALLASGDPAGSLTVTTGYEAAHPDDAERVAAALRLEADALDALGRADEARDRRRQLLDRFPASSAATDLLRDRPDLRPTGRDGNAPRRP